MTDPKNTEQQSEELSLDQLEDAAGGLGGASGPGGTTYLKSNLDTGDHHDLSPQPKTGWSSTDAEFNG